MQHLSDNPHAIWESDHESEFVSQNWATVMWTTRIWSVSLKL